MSDNRNPLERGYNDAGEPCYTYVPGYGFSPPPRHTLERFLLRSYSTGICLALIGTLFLTGFIYGMVSETFFYLFRGVPALRLSQDFMMICSQVAQMISSALGFYIPFAMYRKNIKIPKEVAVPARPISGRNLMYMVPIMLMVSAVGAISSMVISTICAAAGFMPVSPDFTIPPTLGAIVFFAINMTFIPAVFEELVFRGAIMQSLRRFGDSFALIISSFLFALFHANLVQAPTAFLTGLIIGYFVMRTGSLKTGMILHFVNNAVTVLVSLGSLGLSYSYQLILVRAVYFIYIVAGLIALVGFRKTPHGSFTLHPAKTEMEEKSKYKAFFTTASCAVLLVVMFFVSVQYFVVVY